MGNGHNGELYETTIVFPMIPYDLPFHQNGDPKCTSRDMLNFERPYLRNESSVPVHVSFYGRVLGVG